MPRITSPAPAGRRDLTVVGVSFDFDIVIMNAASVGPTNDYADRHSTPGQAAKWCVILARLQWLVNEIYRAGLVWYAARRSSVIAARG